VRRAAGAHRETDSVVGRPAAAAPGEPSGGLPERRPGYSRAELVKDLRCSRARELGLDATAAHVREKLMVFANADRETFVSVATVAAAIGRSEKTVRRALSRLYEAGEVTPRIDVTAWGRRNVYTLTGARAARNYEAPAAPPAAEGEAPVPSCARGQNDPMGTDTVTRPPPPDTLLSDRDQKNDPPPPPLVVDPDSFAIEDRVLARWRDARLPAADELRARVAIRRRVAEGVLQQELLEAVDGARSRSDRHGWTGVVSAFAVVMASLEYVRTYAQLGREARGARERRASAERERRARECAAEEAVVSPASLAKTIAAAAAGRYVLAAQLAQELEREGETREKAASG
jgi:hypothetical protein